MVSPRQDLFTFVTPTVFGSYPDTVPEARTYGKEVPATCRVMSATAIIAANPVENFTNSTTNGSILCSVSFDVDTILYESSIPIFE